jgi:hypothetical protein
MSSFARDQWPAMTIASAAGAIVERRVLSAYEDWSKPGAIVVS